eukprot:EG_transcript_21265
MPTCWPGPVACVTVQCFLHAWHTCSRGELMATIFRNFPHFMHFFRHFSAFPQFSRMNLEMPGKMISSHSYTSPPTGHDTCMVLGEPESCTDDLEEPEAWVK